MTNNKFWSAMIMKPDMKLLDRMQMFSANILGPDAYFVKHWKQLKIIMQQKNPPTIWFTFSAANNHWPKLHSFDFCSFIKQETERKKQKRRTWVRNHDHIVNHFFFNSAQLLFKHFFLKNC